MEREHLKNNRDIPEGNIENEDRISNDNPRNQEIALDLSINNALIRAPSQILSRQLHAPIAHSSRISETDNNHSETNDSAMQNEASAYISLKAALDFLPKYFDGSNKVTDPILDNLMGRVTSFTSMKALQGILN